MDADTSKGSVSGYDRLSFRQVHILHRHGARYPTGADEDAVNDDRFAAKIKNITSTEGPTPFSGPLTVSSERLTLQFLNTWKDMLGRSVLLPTGAAQDYTSGT